MLGSIYITCFVKTRQVLRIGIALMSDEVKYGLKMIDI